MVALAPPPSRLVMQPSLPLAFPHSLLCTLTPSNTPKVETQLVEGGQEVRKKGSGEKFSQLV